MKTILFLTPEDSVPGFALTGIQQQTLSPDETWGVIELACADPEIGVLAADNRLLEGIDPVRLRELTERWPGVFVTLPAPFGRREPARDELQRLVHRALGYHVRLQK
ncbi:MAG: V-type ATP synthase subunit F [Desulfuromonadales bacterium]|jgi:vacuolar-type H+-ATPase subunit F/Vma7